MAKFLSMLKLYILQAASDEKVNSIFMVSENTCKTNVSCLILSCSVTFQHQSQGHNSFPCGFKIYITQESIFSRFYFTCIMYFHIFYNSHHMVNGLVNMSTFKPKLLITLTPSCRIFHILVYHKSQLRELGNIVQ